MTQAAEADATKGNELFVVTLPERLDVSNVDEFIDDIKGKIRAGNRKVVLDFEGTRAIDSTALGAIVQVYKWLRVGQGDLFLVRLSSSVRRIFAITRLDKALDVYDSIEDIPSGK